MKFIITVAALIASLNGMAQGASHVYAANASGSIFVPSLQSINVDLLQDETVLFSKAEEYDQGKVFPNFIRVTVISNTPYLVSVMANGETFSSASMEVKPMPVSIISLRENISSQFMNVSSSAKPLLVSKSSQMKSIYTVDARFNPGWNYSGGQYNTTLTFTLTSQ